MRRGLLRLLPVAAALALAGCAVGPDYQRPEVDVPQQYRPVQSTVDYSQWLDERWWQQYGSDTLNRLVAATLKNNLTLKQVMANVERAAAALTISRADLFPQLGYSGTASKVRSSEKTLQGAQLEGKTVKNYEALASASWELDLWGKIRRQTESAGADLRAVQAAHKAAVSSVVGSVVSTYISLLQIDEQIRIANETAESYKQTYDLFQMRFKYGNLSEMEVVQAKSQWQGAKVQLPSLEQSRTEIMNALSILTGLPVTDFETRDKLASLKMPVIAAGIPSELLTDRPDIVEAEQKLIAANADIGVARAAYFPSISLSAGLGTASTDLKDLFEGPAKLWNFSGSLTGPIFRWGAVVAGEKSAEAQQKAMLASYELTVAQAFADVDNALSARENLRSEEQDKIELVKSLKDYKRLATAQYNGGYTGYVTVLQAEQSLLPQELDLAQVRAKHLSSAVTIYQALGGGWIDKALAEEVKQSE